MKKILIAIIISAFCLIFALLGELSPQTFLFAMCITFVISIIAIYVYHFFVRFSVFNILVDKMKPLEFIKKYHEVDGTNYTNDRCRWEAIAYILLGDFGNAIRLLDSIKPSQNELVKTDVIYILCLYLCNDYDNLKNVLARFKNNSLKNKKNSYYMNFAMLVEAIVFDVQPVSELCKNYFESMPKRTYLEVFISSYIIGDAKLKSNEFEQARELFEHVEKNCEDTVLANKAKEKIALINNQLHDQSGDGSMIDKDQSGDGSMIDKNLNK